jgi:hypothetical protein
MAMESPREQLGEFAHSATDAAQQAMGRQKDTVADSLGSFAGALRDAAKQSGGEVDNVVPIAEWAAEGLDRASYALRSQDVRSMLHSAEVFARRQPLAFFFAAAAAGFLVTRFIKAGALATEAEATNGQLGQQPPASPGNGIDSMTSDAANSDFPPMDLP